MAYLKPQSPIKYKEDHIYPLTTVDQVIMDDGQRLSGVNVYLEKSEEYEDTTVEAGINADTVDGLHADSFALNTELSNLINTVANNYALKSDIPTTALDVGARSDTWLPTLSDLKSIQFATWDGNTSPEAIPIGLTYAEISSTGTDVGFPVGYATCMAIKIKPERTIQLLIEKDNGRMHVRSGIDGTTWGDWQKYLPTNYLYPVGSTYTTTTNVSPASYLGGTWTLIDKQFSCSAFSSGFATAKSGVTISTQYAVRNGKAITIYMQLNYSTAALADTAIELCTISPTALGLSRFTNNVYLTGVSDGGNGLSLSIMNTSGLLTHQDCVTKTSGGSLTASSAINYTFTVVCHNNYIDDTACDKFIWERTE